MSGRRSTHPDTQLLKQKLGSLAEVRDPGESREPILARAVRNELYEWMAELNSREELAAVGLKPRRTALLSGPPGCGKTTLAHHLSARLGIPMVSVGAEGLVDKYLGESGKNVARLFDTITQAGKPCVLFMDEIDAIGKSREGLGGAGADREVGATLTVLLRRIEQFEGLCIAATNRPKDLDPALWRRFHMQIPIELPGPDERFAILKLYAAPFEFDDDALDTLCAYTESASPALLEGLMNGVKRALVIRPRVRKPVDDPVSIFRQILAAVKPPPEIEELKPPLWTDESAVHALAGITWPPRLPAQRKDEAA